MRDLDLVNIYIIEHFFVDKILDLSLTLIVFWNIEIMTITISCASAYCQFNKSTK